MFEKSAMKQRDGQTVIETVAMLLILITIFVLIAEFARAWYQKNSLNNAARVAVRTAAVDSETTGLDEAPCGTDNYIVELVCGSPGVPDNPSTTVTIAINEVSTDGTESNPGDTVSVLVNTAFSNLFPELLKFIPTRLSSKASMRQEL